MGEWTSIVVMIGAYFQLLAIKGPFKMMAKYPEYFLILLILAILWIVITILLFKTVKVMREDLKKGSRRALLLGIIGVNIIVIFGAVSGLIKSLKGGKLNVK